MNNEFYESPCIDRVVVFLKNWPALEPAVRDRQPNRFPVDIGWEKRWKYNEYGWVSAQDLVYRAAIRCIK